MNKRRASYAKKQNLLGQHEQIYFNITERQILNANNVRVLSLKERVMRMNLASSSVLRSPSDERMFWSSGC